MTEPDWLRDYYAKAAADKNIDLQRKDSFTNWALVSLLGFFAVYSQFFSLGLPSFVLIGAMAITIALIMRFYAHSCISYANIRKLNKIMISIEKYWMFGSPDLDEVKSLIRIHGQLRWSVVRGLKVAWTQLKAGFIVILLAPIMVLLFELSQFIPDVNSPYQFFGIAYEYLILIVLIIYVAYEVIIFITYTPLKQKK